MYKKISMCEAAEKGRSSSQEKEGTKSVANFKMGAGEVGRPSGLVRQARPQASARMPN
jgi:hypothetical protein